MSTFKKNEENKEAEGKWKELLKKFDRIKINTKKNGRSCEYGPYVLLEPEITQTNRWEYMAARQTMD